MGHGRSCGPIRGKTVSHRLAELDTLGVGATIEQKHRVDLTQAIVHTYIPPNGVFGGR